MNRIRELRKAKGLTMKKFGSIFSLSESTISLYETGKHYPDIETMKKFADFFEVSVDYILGREDSPSALVVADAGAATLDVTELRDLKNLIQKAIKQQSNYIKEENAATSVQRQIMELKEDRIKLHKRLLAMDDKELDKVEAIIELVEQMRKKEEE